MLSYNFLLCEPILLFFFHVVQLNLVKNWLQLRWWYSHFILHKRRWKFLQFYYVKIIKVYGILNRKNVFAGLTTESLKTCDHTKAIRKKNKRMKISKGIIKNSVTWMSFGWPVGIDHMVTRLDYWCFILVYRFSVRSVWVV